MNALSEFWAVVGDVSDAGVLGVSLGNVVTVHGIFILFLVARRLFFRFVVLRCSCRIIKSLIVFF